MGDWIKNAIQHPGAFTRKASAAGESPAQLQAQALKPGSKASSTTKRQARLRKTLVSFHR